MGVGIVTSSISCLPSDLATRYGIKVVPVPFMLNGRSLLDGVDISATEVYEQLAYELPFRTSAPAPGDFIKAYQEVLSGSKNIICLTVSSKLSMMYDSACDAAKQMPANINVRVIDTGTAAGAQALIDMEAARAASAGATLDEVTKLIENLKDKVFLYGVIVAPKYLARTGRVPSPLPAAASALNIKLVFTIGQGKVKLIGLVRTEKSGMDRMLSAMRAKAGQKRIHAIIQHVNAPEHAESLRQRVQNEFNCAELLITEFSPIIGFATGPGCLALAFRTQD